MFAVPSFLKFLSGRHVFRKVPTFIRCVSSYPKRGFADTSRTDKKQVVVQGTENEQKVRVRRARPGDVPRVLRFVREHAREAWPGLVAPNPATFVVLGDYVARSLAQGHSMLAEQLESRRGWSRIRGLALGGVVSPWDATMLEKWANCIKCTRSRRLMNFTAHCLRAPALHDKYRVHNVLQVFLIVPPDCPKSTEIVHILAKNAIQRARDVGYPVVRFDVTNDNIGKSLEELQLKKEWHLSYDIVPSIQKEQPGSQLAIVKEKTPEPVTNSNYIAVYSAITQADKEDFG